MEFSRERGVCNWLNSQEEENGQGQNRTADTRIFSPLLYRLSYLAIEVKRGILRKSSGESRFRLGSREFFYLFFDEVDHMAFKTHAVERVDLLNSRGAGHVDLGEKAADHVQSGEV